MNDMAGLPVPAHTAARLLKFLEQNTQMSWSMAHRGGYAPDCAFDD